MKQKIITILKKESVLVIASILAILSMFFVPPSIKYVDYIDFRVLGILLSLMTVMAGLQENGLFDYIGRKLLEKTKSTVQLAMVLVFLCFFFSMLITNDVALITFVPFAVLTLRQCKKEKYMIPVIIFQTIGANMGSMLTPIGNPQNLYLYNLAKLTISEFVQIMLPHTAFAGAAIFIGILIFCRGGVIEKQDGTNQPQKPYHQKKSLGYLVLFAACLLVVVRMVDFWIVLLVVWVVTFFLDAQVLKKVDYSLIATFIAFFVFTGNLGRIEVVEKLLQQLVVGREVSVGILTSQFISNVPAALLLSGFTKNYKALLVGVNMGGLGTLIASMASLISYKIYAREYNETKGKYLLCFTIANVLLLVVMYVIF